MADMEFTQNIAHFDKCRTLMRKHQRNHWIRLVLLFLLGVVNGYFYIIPRGTEIITGFMIGIVAFLQFVALLVCALFASPERPKVLSVIFILLAIGIPLQTMSGFIILLCFVIFLTQIPECREAQWVREQPGYPYFNERFEEQLEQAAQGFQPIYDTAENDYEKEGDMPDLADATDSCHFLSEETIAKRKQEVSVLNPPLPPGIAALSDMPPVMQPVAEKASTAAPGISDISAATAGFTSPMTAPPKKEQPRRPAAAPVTEVPVPAVSIPDPITEIPAPVWDVPDPVMDTSIITSDFPEIQGDIPDLPDIPDIPKL